MLAQQLIDIGQAQQRPVVRTGLGQNVVELPFHLADLPGVGIVYPGDHRDPVDKRGQPLPQRPGAAQRLHHLLQAGAELGKPPGQFDAVAADIVERQGGVDPGLRVVGQRHPGQNPVEPEPPGVVDEVDSVGRAVLRVEPPADVGLPHPVGDVLQVVVGEAEAGTHGRGVGDVEHLGGGGPAAGQAQQPGGDRQQRVGLHQRAVGEFHPQLMGRVGAGHHLTEAEVRGDQRRVGLDVGAHHQDVARL